LNARFRDHTCKLFEKHGMTNVGYWVPVENPDSKLVYILAHASRAAADQSWKAFMADADWKKAQQASEVGGRLLAKAPERQYLTATDYSPPVKAPTGGEHLYELRTYTAEAGRLDALNARFRDHTLKLFEKHGMTNVGYWTPVQGEKGADNTLVYLLAHKDKEAATRSWVGFRADADWLAARKMSEAKAGGSLTTRGGVKSEFLKATDYSPMK
jgi:NIPSNAP